MGSHRLLASRLVRLDMAVEVLSNLITLESKISSTPSRAAEIVCRKLTSQHRVLVNTTVAHASTITLTRTKLRLILPGPLIAFKQPGEMVMSFERLSLCVEVLWILLKQP